MNPKLPLLAMVGACALAAAAGSAAPQPTYTLVRARPQALPENAAPVLLVAAVEPRSAAPAAWDERLTRLRRGGYSAAHVTPDAKPGSLTAADLEAFINRLERAQLRVVLGLPAGSPADGVKDWVAAMKPVLTRQAPRILWVQADSTEQAAALTTGLQAAGLDTPVVTGTPVAVTGGLDADRPFRESSVATAVRFAAAEGSSALTWSAPFTGVAPPMMSDSGEGVASVVSDPAMGALPASYYEIRLFDAVVRTLGAALGAATPVEGAGCDAPGITVTQRNAGEQGFLFVHAPGAPVASFHLTFTDPVTRERVSVPRQQGLSLRTLGPGARILPLNLPIPGGRIRYSTAEVFGVHQLGGRTVVMVADDQGAPNEIAFALETAEQPKVAGSAAEPVWDAQGRTLTLGFVPTFNDSLITIGDRLMLAVVSTERAQRTWPIRAGNTSMVAITSAYYCDEGRAADGKVSFRLLTPQGSTAVTCLMERPQRHLAVNGIGPRLSSSPATNSVFFVLRTPALGTLDLKVPTVQVLKQARFQAGEPSGTEAAKPEFAAEKWPEVRLDKPRGAGWYRMPFRLPAAEGWTVPWRLTLQVRGKVQVFVNGQALGTVNGAGEKGEFVDLYLPEAILRTGEQQNLLALAVSGDGALLKVGITPWAEHTLQHQNVVITPGANP